jgi:hypothetical protein
MNKELAIECIKTQRQFVDDLTKEAFDVAIDLLKQPQRTGRWIFDKNDYLTKCSECGCHPWFGVIPTVKEATKKLPHCPMCLAKMEGE